MRFARPSAAVALAASALSLALLTPDAGRAQDILWYSFESQSGDVPNRAAAGPRSARIVSTNKGPDRVPGLYADAAKQKDYALASFDEWDDKTLRAKNHNYLDTGWTEGLSGSFTLAFFVRYGVIAQGGGAQYVFGGDDGFRCFTEGRARQGLSIAGWGGIGYVDLAFDVRAASVNNWLHIAVVFDDKARKARWYIDARLVATVDLLGPIAIGTRKKGLRVGAHDTLQSPNVWHIDDFRLFKGVKTEEEIKIWRYESGKVGDGCGGGTITEARGARASLGGTYDLNLFGAAESDVILGIGFSSTKFGTLDLPLDLGPIVDKQLDGCKWYISPDLLFPAKTNAGGLFPAKIPMPNDAHLAGSSFWVQALFAKIRIVNQKPQTRWLSSNAWRVVVVPR